ncbi:MAG: MBL fold metallo-hydrolase [Candidatus Shapirobacteria bacterium]
MKNRIILFISLLGLVIIFGLTLPSKKAQVVVCDVGQGDAILASYKNIQILIDVGPDNKKVLGCLERHVSFWDKTIEIVILTHGDSDHVGGLNDILKSYKVNQFFSNGLLNKDIEQKIYSKKIGQNDVINTNMFDFEVVSPALQSKIDEDENKNSIAGILRRKGEIKWSMFMSGDIEKETEQRLVWRETIKEKVDVLKVSHHGSETATSYEILDLLKPKMAVISVGKNNRFGHPRGEVLERLNKRNIEIKRTDIDGEVVFKLN